MTKDFEVTSSNPPLAEDTIEISYPTTVIDSAFKDSSLLIGSKDSISIPRHDSVSTKQSFLMDIFELLTCPSYLNTLALTGFGYTVSLVINSIEGKAKIDLDFLISFLIPISFVLSIILLFIPFRKLKLSTILSMIGFFCLSIMSAIFIIEKDLCDVLFGFWIALALYFLNALLLFMVLKKKIEI